jgi:hypothetical protein
MTTPVPDLLDLISVVERVKDPVSVRLTRSLLESHVAVLEAQVAQLRKLTDELGQIEG